jgi:hypothetical protein
MDVEAALRGVALAAASTVEHALSLAGALVIYYVRRMPETCPACGSNRLEPQRGTHPKVPGVEFERPTCAKCGWAGEPVSILADPQAMLTTRSKRRRRMSPGGRWSSLSCPRCRCGSLSNRGETTNKGNEQRNPQRLERPVGNAGIGVEGK